MVRIIVTILAALSAGRLTVIERLVHPSKRAALAVLLLLHAMAPLAAQTPADIARAARGLPESQDLQTELITRTARDLPQSQDLQTELPTTQTEEKTSELRPWNLDTTRTLLWITVLIGACVLAYCIYEIVPTLGGRPPGWDDSADGISGLAHGAGAAAAARLAADELAAQGRFVEAMHVLLLQGLDEMRMRLDLRFADSLTSREIVGRADAPGDAKTALRDIIRWVELAYFGDHPVDRNDYDACRRSYVALDSSLRAGGRG
jgi:hypothetical protein